MTTDSPELNLDKLERCLRDTAVRAGSVVMEYWAAGNPETEWKSDGTPVTTADLRADQIIRNLLSDAFPSIPVISEEETANHHNRHSSFFVVDPIDGTSGFRKGSLEFTVNIALVRKGRPVAGVVFAPAMKRMFLTSNGHRLVEVDNDRTRVLTGRRSAAAALRVTVSRSSVSSSRLNDYLAELNVVNIATMSSSFKFCLLAIGEADIYPRFGRTMEWDTAAGQAILQAVGGTVWQIDGRTPLTYGKENYENPSFVAVAAGVRAPGVH